MSSSPSVPIAIIGMSCKFAGDVDSPSKLWDLLAAGKDGWSPIPRDRFDPKALYHPDQRRTDRVGSAQVPQEGCSLMQA